MPSYGDTSKGGGRPPSSDKTSGNPPVKQEAPQGESIMDRKRREAKAHQSNAPG